MEMEEGRSAIWARLDGVEREFTRLQNERDTAILERDKARAALGPILEQVEALLETVLGQMSKRDARLPSAKAYSVTPEMVDGWVKLYEGGMSLTRIAQGSRATAETVKAHLQGRGIEARGKRRFGHGSVAGKPKGQQGERVPRCVECNLPLDSPALTNGNVPEAVDGVCGLCQFIASDLADKRAEGKEGHGNGHSI